MWFLIYTSGQTNTQTGRHTDTLITILRLVTLTQDEVITPVTVIVNLRSFTALIVYEREATDTNIASMKVLKIVTGPPNGTVLFCSLSSVVVVCRTSSVTLPAGGGRAGWLPAAWAVGRPTLHGGQVRSRPVRATPC